MALTSCCLGTAWVVMRLIVMFCLLSTGSLVVPVTLFCCGLVNFVMVVLDERRCRAATLLGGVGAGGVVCCLMIAVVKRCLLNSVLGTLLEGAATAFDWIGVALYLFCCGGCRGEGSLKVTVASFVVLPLGVLLDSVLTLRITI